VTEVRTEVRAFRQATTASFNAMREDLTSLREQMNNGFAEIHGRLDAADRGFAEVNRSFAQVRGVLDGQAAGQQRIVEMLNVLIDREGGRPEES
jgi:hypothetical protein